MLKKNKISKIKKRDLLRITIILVIGLSLMILTSFLVKEINKLEEKELELINQNDPRLEFYRSMIPIRNWDVSAPVIAANGYLIASFNQEKNPKILFEKNRTQKLPIASIAKLMTAIIVLEEYNPDEIILISEEAFLKDITRPNNLYPGETYKIKDLLYSLLIESGNTAAHALAQRISTPYYQPASVSFFVSRMNQKALSLGMNNTRFINPTGLDPINHQEAVGYSSPEDLLILAKYILDQPEIMKILSVQSHDLKTSQGDFKYTMINTNRLLNEPYIIGGKTGQTARARGCLLMISNNPKNNDYLISIVLGSRDRFEETEKLLNSATEAFYWKKI